MAHGSYALSSSSLILEYFLNCFLGELCVLCGEGFPDYRLKLIIHADRL
jgi:hypothetical protein